MCANKLQSFKMVVAYDGTDYAGWQEQEHRTAIVNVLQSRFYKAFKKEIKIIGASRTDAGVHALGQVARFQTDLSLDVDRIHRIWNDALPFTISIQELKPCPETFSPWVGVIQKTYWYHVSLERPSPFVQRYCSYYPYKPNLDKLQELLSVFRGTHDFRSFVSSQDTRDTLRTIDDIQITFNEQFKAYCITFKGKSFLHYMIRRIVGACLYGACKPEITADVLKELLDEKKPAGHLPKAPAKGLLLYTIQYREDI